ncbi:hypothetical protein [Streptomyces gardneri]|uniref:Uncharacterized protein n=1 Tax=Streptomyces gardneri TaxID=66892 RepID=A0A4Y3RNH3_9ACTN|nr:hypothetical protein [Streptomyces gardneri]GEB57390.1 hypothetical protein SGA01_29950 [Streptomyces gardneri]GHH12838.1 hypothetical protein GCM10017674_59270 [Streptomyces gardneri]
MDENADQQPPTEPSSPADASAATTIAPATVSSAYAAGQLARALRTSVSHPEPATRDRAVGRVQKWRAVLAGMADGSLTIGARTPVAGLPAWVTPEVVRGGFATGTPCAGGPLAPYEADAARRAGVPADRAALFAHALTQQGLEELWQLLDTGRYEVSLPEEAALLTVAWLVRADDFDTAAALVTELQPFADRLRFLPRPADGPAPDASAVHRCTVGQVSDVLRARGPKTAIEVQREALGVWRPFDDELLAYWLQHLEASAPARSAADRPAPQRVPGPGPAAALTGPGGGDARVRATALLQRYRALAATHTQCRKHRDQKSNTGIMLRALEETAAGRPLTPRLAGLLRHAVTSVVAKRGLPGSDRHSRLRAEQARQAALPAHHEIAAVVADRLATLDQRAGTPDVDGPLAPITRTEAGQTGLPAGTVVPPRLRQVVRTALSATPEELVARGLVPSAEVLAELVPQLVANATAQRYADPSLRTLTAATYRAFRNRRSLLLLNLAHQVRADELPWVRAVAGHGSDADTRARARAAAEAVLRRLGDLAVGAFPGTLLPNPLVREMSQLARQADLSAPFTEELAADIFMGTFSPKFLTAARIAADLLEDSLYTRYYGIDCAAVRNLAVVHAVDNLGRTRPARTAPAFDRLCGERAGTDTARSWSPAGNGTVIEQAQILTTHNLAVLVRHAGIAPEAGWEALAEKGFDAVCRLVARVHGHPRPLGTIKDAAYAWRQTLFFLSLCPPGRQATLVQQMAAQAAEQPWHTAARLAPAIAGLRLVAGGGTFDTDGTALNGLARRFQGWTTTGHWMRSATR